MLKKLILISITLLILISCATSPLGRSQLNLISPTELNKMGSQAFQSLKEEKPIETSRSVNRYVSCIANAIIQISNSQVKQWEVLVFRDESANAFALPGGKVGVHTGLLKIAENQHQLAAVIGHEIAHVLANHSNERVSQEFALQQGLAIVQILGDIKTPMGQQLMGLLGIGAQVGILLPYSRVHESEADEMGLYLMAKAGFNPKESVNLWQNMSRGSNGEQPPEFFSTHPSHDTRIARLNQIMDRAMSLYQQASVKRKKPNCRL
ncbi:MAG: M48 family peptidase [Gammaproteobacteria bacterium]|nr:MAG: M48 family peptidase [Gammaproteobacteria bacterium]RKZ75595.1 MAG: M48 family peptidase [Gammaproteobacteria bacterium]